MAHINTAVLIAQATNAAYRANRVRQDPAVIKSAKQAIADIAQAGRSTAEFAMETRGAWLRSAQPGR